LVNVNASALQVEADKHASKPRHFFVAVNGGYAMLSTRSNYVPYVSDYELNLRSAHNTGLMVNIAAGYQFQRHPQRRWDFLNQFSVGFGVNYMSSRLIGDAYATKPTNVSPLGKYIAEVTNVQPLLMLSTNVIEYQHIALQLNGGIGFSYHTTHLNYTDTTFKGSPTSSNGTMIYQLGLGLIYHFNNALAVTVSYQTLLNDNLILPFDLKNTVQTPKVNLEQSVAQLGVKYSF